MWEFTKDNEVKDLKIGIEIEVETRDRNHNDLLNSESNPLEDYYTLVYDASLQRGREFVSRKPPEPGQRFSQKPIQVKEVQIFFEQYLKCIGNLPVVVESERTSTHIHIEACELEKSTGLLFKNLLVVEDVLVDIYGKGREQNQYCTRLSPFRGKVALKDHTNVRRLTEGRTRQKYKAIAVRSELGTIEIRLARLMTDPEIFSEYLGILLQIQKDSVKGISYIDDLNRITSQFPKKYEGVLENKACLLAVWSK